MTKKSQVSTTPNTFGGADVVPQDDAPTPPKSYAPQKLGRGKRPTKAVMHAAPQVVAELRSSTTYESTFGALVPPAAPLADAIEFASSWSDKRAHAEAWRKYVTQQETLAWRHALSGIETLRPSYVAAASLDPTLPSVFAKTALLYASRSQSAAKGAASKKARKAAEAAAKAAAEAQSTAAASGTKALGV